MLIAFFSHVAMLLGFFMELLVGWRLPWHPIMGIGSVISSAEEAIRGALPKTKAGERFGGALLVLTVIFISVVLPFAVLSLGYMLHQTVGIILETVMCWAIFATGSLAREARKVRQELEVSLDRGRRAVSMIVGRDTESLDETGVIKATVETVAENLSDGVIAPLLFLAVGGVPLGFFYKAVNTMDSMVGYRNDNYRYFGTAAAVLDDICNFIPARVSALLMIFMSRFAGLDRGNAKRIFLRDRHNHASPNSAQTESVMAGALNVQLAGDACYFGKLYKKKTIGDPVRHIMPEDIDRSVKLMVYTCVFAAAVCTVIKLAVRVISEII